MALRGLCREVEGTRIGLRTQSIKFLWLREGFVGNLDRKIEESPSNLPLRRSHTCCAHSWHAADLSKHKNDPEP